VFAVAAVFAATAGASQAATGRPPRAAGVDGRLAAALDRSAAGTRVHAWVYFTDKGPRDAVGATAITPVVSPRSLARRAKAMAPGDPRIAFEDAPLHRAYVARVASRVTRVRHESRWFNAVSVEATPAQIRALRALPEVRRLELVARYKRRATPALESPVAPIAPPATRRNEPRRPAAGLDYGPSLLQSELLRVPELHLRGLTGKGVLIGHFDNGHRLMSHQVFASIQVVAERDFVDHDGDTAPPPAAPDFFGAHGINTLSVLAGNAPGQLIGPAFGADYALARTENDASESPLEEDNWVAAIEWADSLGCDIVSSSVGYLEFDDPQLSYTWEDMDGNTAVITRAADRAVARGVIVVTAAGNFGAATGGRGNMLNAPADADSALAIGGVWVPPGATEPEWYFTSSVGPTANMPPRTKPDLAAPGAAIYLAGTDHTTHYGYNSGTSFACPLVAGVVALLLEAQPQTPPLVMRAALRATASRATDPDNRIGWGVVDAVAALTALETPIVPATFGDVKRRYR
jgi:hypothetical protein